MKFGQWRSSSLRQRFTIGIVARVLPLVALTFGAITMLEYTISSFEERESQTLADIFPLKALEELMFDASQPPEDYLNSGDRQLRARFNTLSEQIDFKYQHLLETTGDDPDKQPLVLASQKSWQRLRKVAIEILKSPFPLDRENTKREHQRLDIASREAIEGISRIYNLLYHAQRYDNLKQAEALQDTVRLIAQILLGVELTLAAISGFILFRSVLVPLKILEMGIQQLSDGNLDYRINLKSSDELGRLAATLNLMAGKLQQTQTELRDLAIKDGLTGLYNRREFNNIIKSEIERSRRYSQDCSLLMMDIDHFKKLNDTYGHPGGDEALKTVASLLQKEIRPVDRVARYGGEEFAVILPQTSSESAAVVAERLRHAIATYLVPVSETQKINITVSLGCASCPDDANSAESLISAADVALYTAKNSGRNRVVTFNSL